MADKFVFHCPHCGEQIVVSKPSFSEEKFVEVVPAVAVSPDEIPTTAIEVEEIPLKDVILEPEPIEELEPEELDGDFEPIEELSPEDLQEYMPRTASPVSRRARPDAPARPDRSGPRPPRRPGREMPDKGRRGAKPARPVRGKAPAPGSDYAVILDPMDRDLENVAIDLIMDFAGVDENTAIKIIEREPIIAVRDVSKEEAEEALDAFDAEGITGTIRQRKPRR